MLAQNLGKTVLLLSTTELIIGSLDGSQSSNYQHMIYRELKEKAKGYPNLNPLRKNTILS